MYEFNWKEQVIYIIIILQLILKVGEKRISMW